MADWTLVREVASDSNNYDRYWDKDSGSAMVYRNGRAFYGYTNGRPFRAPLPDGNVQAVRIRPEMGQWWLYTFGDVRDGYRLEHKTPVADL